jgi:hypothetical protein
MLVCSPRHQVSERSLEGRRAITEPLKPPIRRQGVVSGGGPVTFLRINLSLHFCDRSHKDDKRASSLHPRRRFRHISANVSGMATWCPASLTTSAQNSGTAQSNGC